MMQLLDWSYEKSINGLPGAKSAYELANQYRSKHPTTKKSIDSLIRWQNTKNGVNGFISGLGGLITMPFVLPANIVSVIYVQMRMVAAIAVLNGYDLKDDQVKTLVYVSLAGNSATDVLKGTGIAVSNKVATTAIKRIPGETLKVINQKVGFRLLTKFGEKGIINLGKLVPVAGGVVGGSIDVFSTYAIGKAAKKLLVNK